MNKVQIIIKCSFRRWNRAISDICAKFTTSGTNERTNQSNNQQTRVIAIPREGYTNIGNANSNKYCRYC